VFGEAYGSALVIVAGSFLLGRAVCTACGGRGRWAGAPLIGLAALMVLADAAISLPGRGVTAAAVCTLAILVSAAVLLWRGPLRASTWRESVRSSTWRQSLRLPGGDLVVGGLALLGASVPFVANGRVGPGAGIDNDMAIHLLVAEALRSSRMAAIWNVLSSGYPTGPHSAVAAIGTAFDLPLIMVFTGLMLAVVVLTALSAGDLLAAEALWRRVVIGVLCSLTYLVAAFYGEGAFKETIMAGLLLGFVAHLEQVRARWGEATPPRRFALTLPAAVLVAGAIYTYSYLGVAWFGATLVVWVAAEAALAPRLARGWISLSNLAAAMPWAAGLLALGLIVLIPIAGDLHTFFNTLGVSPATTITTANLGNLLHPLPAIESLGVWWSPDFRQDPANILHAGELSGLALVAVVFGLVQAVRRRQLVLAAAVGACGLIWWYSDRTQSPYVTAKALVISSPVVMAIALRGLLTRWRGPRSTRALLLACGAAFCASAGYSSYRSLQSELVQAPEAGSELAAFHHVTGDATVLFLGVDDWAPWELRDSPVATLSDPTPTVGGAASPPNKPFLGGQSLDFDSVIPNDLDNFRYVITTNTSFASQPPANFHLLASRRLYLLWKRMGPTPQFESIEPPGAPGALLDCRVPILRHLSADPGEASLMAKPVTVPGINLAPGGAGLVRLPLPAGAWQLSVAYTSIVTTDFAVQGKRYSLPAFLGRPGSYFDVGSVTGEGVGSPIILRVSAERPSFLSGNLAYMDITRIAATRIPDVRRLVPLRQACGQYVDWFRLR
jgi:hypothetical protein